MDRCMSIVMPSTMQGLYVSVSLIFSDCVSLKSVQFSLLGLSFPLYIIPSIVTRTSNSHTFSASPSPAQVSLLVSGKDCSNRQLLRQAHHTLYSRQHTLGPRIVVLVLSCLWHWVYLAFCPCLRRYTCSDFTSSVTRWDSFGLSLAARYIFSERSSSKSGL